MTPPKRTNRGPRRWLAAAAAAALGSALLPVSTASAAIDTSEACPEEIPSTAFTDIAGNPAASAIECLAAYGVTQGVSETSYGPAIPINRAQVATFLIRILEGVDPDLLPGEVDDAFDDDNGHAPHEKNINIAAHLEILNGYGDGTFRPLDLVTRAQMAKLVVNTLGAAGVDLPEDPDDAFDDDEGNVHENLIDTLAALDVVEGVQVRTYGPSGNVRRDTMARFLTRSIQVLVNEGLREPLVAPVALGAALTGGDNFTFGDQDGDAITVLYDAPVSVDAASTITVDPDGAGPLAPAVFGCGPLLPCVAVGNAVTFTVGDNGAVTGDVFVGEGAQIVATSGVTGAGGLTPDDSYPVDLVVAMIGTDLAAEPVFAGEPAEFEIVVASNVAVEGTTVAMVVDVACVDTDGDGVGDDPGFTLGALQEDDAIVPLDLTCLDDVVGAAFPEDGIDLAPAVSVSVPLSVTFDEVDTYPVLLTLVAGDDEVLAATAIDLEVLPPA